MTPTEKHFPLSFAAPIVSMITNCINDEHRNSIRQRQGYLAEGVANPLTFSYGSKQGRVYFLDVTPTELLSLSGVKLAKKYFLQAVDHAVAAGVKVILLAASTKRLFGDGTELKTLYPNTIFTIGDNGTSLAFLKQIDYLCTQISQNRPIVVLGAGFLGEMAIEHLVKNNFKKIVIITKHKTRFSGLLDSYTSLEEYIASPQFEGAALFLGCAHNHNVSTEELAALIQDKLLVLDVAVPKAVPLSIAAPLGEQVLRFDAGDYEMSRLKFDFPAELLGLNFEGEFYGCFTEALFLALSQQQHPHNFFHVSEANIQLISSILKKFDQEVHISLKNYGHKVAGFKSVLTV